MKKATIALVFIISGSIMYAQDYIDLVKVSYNSATLGNLENDQETTVGNTLAEVYFPVPINDKAVVIAGFTYENTRLGLGFTDDRTNLILTRLNLGLKIKHGNNWSGTYVALPKFASDFDGIGGEDFQMGGLALFEKKYKAKYGLKFGAYMSSENFGTTLTPLVGVWYKSSNSKFYINATLPIRADVNYSLTEYLSVGANLLTSVKSYNLAQTESLFYTQEESIRFALFTSYGFLDNNLILRGKVGLDTTDYGVYNEGDTIGLQVLTFQVGGDDRNRLNAEFDSSLFVGVDLIFRAAL